MEKRPLSVSLAIPCFNADSYIQSALDSIYSQTVAPDEIIIVNDGSTDKTTEVLRQHSTLKVINHQDNLGIAGSRNSALVAACGDIIVFMDADGIADPQFIEKLLTGYSDDRVGGVGGKGIEAIQNTFSDRWRKEVLFQHWGKLTCKDVPFLFGLCSSYRKSALKDVNGFDQIFKTSGEDMDVGFRLHEAGYTLSYYPEAKVYHQREDNRQSIKKMAYRHCLYGFLAQRRNNNFANKTPFLKSINLYLKHIFFDGLAKGSISYATQSTQLHLIMMMAWLDAAKLHKTRSNDSRTTKDIPWEGHN